MYNEITLPVLMWLPLLLVCGTAALGWLVVARFAAPRSTGLQFMAVALGCAHATGAGRAILTAVGYVPTDVGSVVVHTVTAAACCGAAICLAVRWAPKTVGVADHGHCRYKIDEGTGMERAALTSAAPR